MSIPSCQFIHLNSFMSIHVLQVMRFKSFMSIDSCQFLHFNSFVSIHSWQFIRFNSCVSIPSFQVIHVNWFMSIHSFHAFHFTSFQLTMNSYKPYLFFETSAPARAGHYLVMGCYCYITCSKWGLNGMLIVRSCEIYHQLQLKNRVIHQHFSQAFPNSIFLWVIIGFFDGIMLFPYQN